MRIAILSAGPSLKQTYRASGGPAYDLRIAVNAAAEHFHCDWWSCGDAFGFNQFEKCIGVPALLTITESDAWFRRRSATAQRLAKHRVMTWAQLYARLEAAGRSINPTWQNWSITAALVLAVEQGLPAIADGQCLAIDVYGHDLVGTADVSGFDVQRRNVNFPRVASDWQAARAWAESVGHVVVREIRPDTTPSATRRTAA